MKKLLAVCLIGALLCGGCAKRQSDDEQPANGQTAENDPSQATADVTESSNNTEEEQLDIIDAQFAQNADALTDFLSANPIATSLDGYRCWTDEGRFVLMSGPQKPNWGYLEDEMYTDLPILNHRIDDPVVGDQFNFLFIREMEEERPRQLKLKHMMRDDSYIMYQLEPNRDYEMLVYVQNNAWNSIASDKTSGAAESISIATNTPKLLTGSPKGDFFEVLLMPEFTDGNARSRALPHCDTPVTLLWDNELRCYDVDGKYVETLSLDPAQNSSVRISETDSSFSLRITVAEDYPAGAANFYRFVFHTSTSLKDLTIPNADETQ